MASKNQKAGAGKPAAKTKAKAEKKGAKKGALERHPLSAKYGPNMTAEELAGLKADVKAHGMHEPIIMYEGKVLAGWNRYLVCHELGIEPERRELAKGKDPAAVAFGTNFMRRRLSSVQKAFFGAQFCVDTGAKQTDVATMLACNLNRLNQCCQLLKQDTAPAKKAVDSLRDNPDMGSAQFDEMMLELGIAREAKPRANPARASGGGPLDGDDLDDLDADDLTGGAIDNLLGDEEDLNGDEPSPAPASRKAKTGGGEDEPLPAVGAKRNNSLKNPHETPVSRVAKAYKSLSEAEQRQFVLFTWKRLKIALDAAIGGADVEYTPPEVIKADPSRIARNKPTGKLDDGHTPKGKGKKAPAKSAKAPAKSAKKASSKGSDKDI